MKAKLVIATDSFLPRWDGISRVLKEIIPYLAKDFDVTILAPKFSGEIKELIKAHLVLFKTYKFKIAHYPPAKVKRAVIKKHIKDADIVWTHTIGPIGAVSMQVARKYQKPLVSYMHSIEWDLFSKSLKRGRGIVEKVSKSFIPYIYNKCDMLMVPSASITPLIRDQGIKADVEVVQLGVDVAQFIPPKDKKAAKKNIGFKDDEIVIGYLGRFGLEKDLQTLYEAFRKIAKKNKKANLLLVGDKLDSPFKSMENVKVVGPTNNPLKYYQAMDIYVLPSLTETTSLTTLEAMSCGIPPVCTPVGHIKNYIDHKFNGFLFPQGNSVRLSLLLELLIADEELRLKVGKNARKTVVAKHSWHETAEIMSDLLKRHVRIVDESNPSHPQA